MRDSIKRKIHRLLHAINEALSDSCDISDSVEGVRDEGYDLFLILEATVVLNRQGDVLAMDSLDWDEDELMDDDLDDLEDDLGDEEEKQLLLAAEAAAELNPDISEEDQEFLRTLGIRLED